jgi:hypothetical protein
MAHRPRHSGGFSSGQSVIGGGSSSTPSPPQQPSSPQDYFGSMYTSPGSSTQQQSVDPILNAAAVQAANQAAQQSDPIPGGTMIIGSGNPNQQAAQTMLQAGITNLGGSTPGFQGTGSGNLTVTSGSGQGTDTSGTDDKGKGLVETLLSNTVIANLLKGAQSTDRFFNNLTEKGVDGLTPEDKVILANLIGRGGLDTIDLNKYTTDDVDFEELGKRFTEAASGLENKDYESLVDSYLSNKPTGIDSLTTMGSDVFNLFGDPRLRRDDKSLTLEGLQNSLGPEGIAYLKATNPKLYYSFTDPQTSGGLEELAQFDLSTLGGSPEDRRLSARVMAAREATSNQGGGGQAGIANISIPQTGQANIIDPTNQYGLFIGKPGPFIGNFVDSDGDGVDDRFQTGPGQPSSQPSDMKKPLPTTGIPQAVGVPAALNYANIAPQFTGYTNQGVSPMLGDYYGNLRRFYG